MKVGLWTSILICSFSAVLLRAGRACAAAGGDPSADDAPEATTPAAMRHEHRRVDPQVVGPRDGLGGQFELMLGVGQDHTSTNVAFPSDGSGPMAMMGVAAAALVGPWTLGLRYERNAQLLGSGGEYYLLDVGQHFRSGRTKVSAVLEVGAHHFINVGEGLLESIPYPNSTFLPSVGGRLSVDFAPGSAPEVGWFMSYEQDVATTTIDPGGDQRRFNLGGGLFETGVQLGFDFQFARSRAR